MAQNKKNTQPDVIIAAYDKDGNMLASITKEQHNEEKTK